MRKGGVHISKQFKMLFFSSANLLFAMQLTTATFPLLCSLGGFDIVAHKPVFHLLQAVVSVTLQHNRIRDCKYQLKSKTTMAMSPSPEQDCPLGGS